jgi:hypothetical protein
MSCEHGKEQSGSVKGGKCFDRLTISFSKTLLHGVKLQSVVFIQAITVNPRFNGHRLVLSRI